MNKREREKQYKTKTFKSTQNISLLLTAILEYFCNHEICQAEFQQSTHFVGGLQYREKRQTPGEQLREQFAQTLNQLVDCEQNDTSNGTVLSLRTANMNSFTANY